MKSKYNPPPKVKATLSEKVSEILSSSQFVHRQKMPSTSNASNASKIFSTSDSGSSDEDVLVKPKKSVYNSAISAPKQPQPASTSAETQPPNFDCNIGVRLSDSSDDDDEDDDDDGSFVEIPNKESVTAEPMINDAPSTQTFTDLSHFNEFHRNLESAKQEMIKFKEQEQKQASTSKAADVTDISKLLLMGEGIAGKPSSTPGTQKRKHQNVQNSDDSDWENVSGKKRKVAA